MICNKCELDKPEENFSFKDKTKGIKRKQCKDCIKEYRKLYYSENREAAIKYSMVTTKKTRERNRQYIWNYLLGHPCIDCGEADPIVLEFDHRDGTDKVDHVCKGVENGWGLEKLQNEINKCDIRCANCHRRRTAIQFKYYKSIIKM